MVSSNGSSNMVQPSTMPATTTTMDPTATPRRPNDNRRSNKPIMEKRRRARINNCLNELKALILDAMKKDPARHSKLEKADILEMTVKHLQNLQRQQAAMSAATDPSVINKFRAGFSECAVEVGRFPGIDPMVKRRLLQHLASCLNQSSKQQQQEMSQQVQVHILPTPAATTEQIPHSNGIILSNGNGTGVQLVPTRLPNGDIALVLPATAANAAQNNQPLNSSMPLLVPIPQRTASTTSASSSNYSPSPSHSPEPMDTTYNQPKPLALVTRRAEPVEERPWRPW